MSYLKLAYSGQRLSPLNLARLVHRLRLVLGLRGRVPRPVPLVSRLPSGAERHESSRTGGPIRVLVFSHNLSHEGASISLKELVFGLKHRQAIAPKVVAFEDGPLGAEYESAGIPVQILPRVLQEISTTARLALEVERLASVIRSAPCDAVFANTLLNFPAILAAEHAGIPSIWNPRESEPWDIYFRFLPDPVAQAAIAAIGLPKKVVFVAEATRAVWQDFDGAGSFTVIHNALNPERFASHLQGDVAAVRKSLGWTEDEIVFLCVGTVCERKGQEDALLALARLSSPLKRPIRLIFAGQASGAYARRLRELASTLSGREGIAVQFVEATSQIGQYYLSADAFLLSSRVESYPRVILEAMVFGLPIISTPVFGVTEQLPDPADACFYKPGDIVGLATHIRDLVNDDSMRQRYSDKSKAQFGRLHSFEDMCGQYRRVIEETVRAD